MSNWLLYFVFLVSCDCYCFVALPYSAVGWSAMCDCGISGNRLTYYFKHVPIKYSSLSSYKHMSQGRIQDFWKEEWPWGGGGGGGGLRCWFYLIFLKYTMKLNNLVSLRPNYFIFIGYLKTGGGEGGSS